MFSKSDWSGLMNGNKSKVAAAIDSTKSQSTAKRVPGDLIEVRIRFLACIASPNSRIDEWIDSVNDKIQNYVDESD